MQYDPSEQNAITGIFAEMLDACTKDGGNKRAAGTKVDWKVDDSHWAAVWSHFGKHERGELVDEDSGAHPLVHAAWRLLAIAYQETHDVARAEEREILDSISARDCAICDAGGLHYLVEKTNLEDGWALDDRGEQPQP